LGENLPNMVTLLLTYLDLFADAEASTVQHNKAILPGANPTSSEFTTL
jgi:hypothetical protein